MREIKKSWNKWTNLLNTTEPFETHCLFYFHSGSLLVLLFSLLFSPLSVSFSLITATLVLFCPKESSRSLQNIDLLLYRRLCHWFLFFPSLLQTPRVGCWWVKRGVLGGLAALCSLVPRFVHYFFWPLQTLFSWFQWNLHMVSALLLPHCLHK